MWLGPNAVLAFKREGYRWSDVSLKDLKEILTYPGFYRLAVKYVKFGSMEMVRMTSMAMWDKSYFREYFPCPSGCGNYSSFHYIRENLMRKLPMFVSKAETINF